MIAPFTEGLATFSLVHTTDLVHFVDSRQNFESKPHEHQFELQL